MNKSNNKGEKKMSKPCVICGGLSPNTYGECLCSYEYILNCGTWEEIARLMGRKYLELFNFTIRKDK